jgi:diguanylate cyclase (GGDEF)-like protein
VRFRTAVFAVVGTALGYQVLVPWLPRPAGYALSDTLIAVAVGWAAVNFRRGATAEVGRLRAAMNVGSLSSVAWALANALDLIGDTGLVPSFRGLGNVLALSSAVGLPLGLILLAPPAPGADRFRRLLDVASVAGAVFALAWLYVLQPGMEADGDDITGPYATWLTIPEVLAAAYALVIMSGNLPSRGARAPRLLAGASVVLAGTALMGLRNYVDGRTWYFAGVGAGYLLAAGLLTLASREPPMRPDPAGARRHISGAWAALPYVPITLAVLAAAMQQIRAGALRPVFVWVLLTTFSLVLVRQFLTMRVVATQAIELERQQAALAHQAHHDALTGLPNRAAFHRRGSAMLAASPGMVMVMLLDLDGFKPVNDRLGHAAGDEVLMLVARRLQIRLRTSDLVARIGGDEFAMLLTRVTSESEGLAVAERLLRDIIEPILTRNMHVIVGGSIGVTCGTARDSLSALLREADTAMYSAKLKGKGTVHRFEHAVAALPWRRDGRQHTWAGDGRQQPWTGDGRRYPWTGDARDQTWTAEGQRQVSTSDGQRQAWTADGHDQTWAETGQRQTWSGQGHDQTSAETGQHQTWSGQGHDQTWAETGQHQTWNGHDQHQARNGDGQQRTWNGNGGAHSL